MPVSNRGGGIGCRYASYGHHGQRYAGAAHARRYVAVAFQSEYRRQFLLGGCKTERAQAYVIGGTVERYTLDILV